MKLTYCYYCPDIQFPRQGKTNLRLQVLSFHIVTITENLIGNPNIHPHSWYQFRYCNNLLNFLTVHTQWEVLWIRIEAGKWAVYLTQRSMRYSVFWHLHRSHLWVSFSVFSRDTDLLLARNINFLFFVCFTKKTSKPPSSQKATTTL